MRSHSRLGKRAKIKPKHVVYHWKQSADLLLKILVLVRALPFKISLLNKDSDDLWIAKIKTGKEGQKSRTLL